MKTTLNGNHVFIAINIYVKTVLLYMLDLHIALNVLKKLLQKNNNRYAEGEMIMNEKQDKTSEEYVRKQRLSEYERLLKHVTFLSEMCETVAFKKHYRHLLSRKYAHEKLILSAEKTRDILRSQEAIKEIDEILETLSLPVKELNDFCREMPLFAEDFHTRAEWKEEAGIVEFSHRKL